MQMTGGATTTNLTTFICFAHIVDRPPTVVMSLAGNYCIHTSTLALEADANSCITTTALDLVEKYKSFSSAGRNFS